MPSRARSTARSVAYIDGSSAARIASGFHPKLPRKSGSRSGDEAAAEGVGDGVIGGLRAAGCRDRLATGCCEHIDALLTYGLI